MLVPYTDARWDTVRRFADQRLAGMLVQILYNDKFRLYVPAIGTMLYPSYEKIHAAAFDYSGEFAMVGLGEEDEDFFLGRLKRTDSDDLYMVYEIPMAFSRLPVRTLTINVCNILCIMKRCSLK